MTNFYKDDVNTCIDDISYFYQFYASGSRWLWC